MRKLLAILALLLLPVVALAHSGRTDSSGGHYNRSTGEYHYHHGEPAHQHPNGVCPYASPKPTVQPTPMVSSTNSVYPPNGSYAKRKAEEARKQAQQDTLRTLGIACGGSGIAFGTGLLLGKRKSKK